MSTAIATATLFSVKPSAISSQFNNLSLPFTSLSFLPTISSTKACFFRPPPFLSTSISCKSSLDTDQEEEEDEQLELDVEFDEFDDEIEEIDFDELEQEAKVAVREYSSSLSKELIIDDETDTKKESRKQRRNKLTIKEKFRLIDTAGIRKRTAVASAGSTTEALSVNRAFRAIRRSDVVALVIEAMACITEQDFKIAERIEKEGKGCLIVVNKWDTIPNKSQQTALHYEEDVREKLRLLQWAPIVYATAISGHSVDRVIVAASEVEMERSRRLSTATLNQVVQESLAFKSPPRTRGGKSGRVYYCTQAAIRPPTFVFFVNDSNLFPETYRRYMEKQLRANAGFPGTPIRLLWRSRKKTGRPEGKGAAGGGGGARARLTLKSSGRKLASLNP